MRTTAAGALAGGVGVCQDDAHVILARGRLLGLPARHASGHLVGEGGSHAWAEVLVADRNEEAPGATAVAFDPTHDRETDLGYLTVAVGRDYADVAPTSGAFVGSCAGRLSSTERLGLSRVELAPTRRSS